MKPVLALHKQTGTYLQSPKSVLLLKNILSIKTKSLLTQIFYRKKFSEIHVIQLIYLIPA